MKTISILVACCKKLKRTRSAIYIIRNSILLRYHRVGRAIYAIGGNTEAARAAGIPVNRIRICVSPWLARLIGTERAYSGEQKY